MDIFDLSPKGKKRFAKWIGKRHRKLCISELVRNSRDERQLFAMCRYIDRWYDQHEPSMKPLEASTELSEEMYQDSGQQEDQEEVAPDVALKVEPETYVKPQKEISKKTKGRINEFILNHPGAPISEIVSSAADEDELLRTIEEMDKVVPVDTRIKLWTCVPSRRL